MQTHQLKRNHPNMKRVIVARGGKRGKTAGRGGKGQSARAGNKRRPEWRDIIKRIPKLRGRGVNQNKPVTEALKVVNVSVLETTFSAGDSITPTILVEKGVIATISGRMPAVKILGDGEVTKAFKISGCTISGSAQEKIEKAGGTITALKSRVVVKVKAPKSLDAKKEIGKDGKIDTQPKVPVKEKAKPITKKVSESKPKVEKPAKSTKVEKPTKK